MTEPTVDQVKSILTSINDEINKNNNEFLGVLASEAAQHYSEYTGTSHNEALSFLLKKCTPNELASIPSFGFTSNEDKLFDEDGSIYVDLQQFDSTLSVDMMKKVKSLGLWELKGKCKDKLHKASGKCCQKCGHVCKECAKKVCDRCCQDPSSSVCSHLDKCGECNRKKCQICCLNKQKECNHKCQQAECRTRKQTCKLFSKTLCTVCNRCIYCACDDRNDRDCDDRAFLFSSLCFDQKLRNLIAHWNDVNATKFLRGEKELEDLPNIKDWSTLKEKIVFYQQQKISYHVNQKNFQFEKVLSKEKGEYTMSKLQFILEGKLDTTKIEGIIEKTVSALTIHLSSCKLVPMPADVKDDNSGGCTNDQVSSSSEEDSSDEDTTVIIGSERSKTYDQSHCITNEELSWSIKNMYTIYECSHGKTATSKKTSILNLLQSIMMGNYTLINKELGWKSGANGIKCTIQFYPLDFIYRVMCEMTLPQRGMFIKKLSLCKFAVPLLMQIGKKSMFMDYSLQHLQCQWKDDNGELKEGDILKAEIPLVALIRIGEAFVSKSLIGNGILGIKFEYGFFTNKNRRSNYPRDYSDQTLQITTHQVSEEEENFPNSVCLANLRGDGIDCQQFQSIVDASDIVFLFISCNTLSNPSENILKTFKQLKSSEERKEKISVLTTSKHSLLKKFNKVIIRGHDEMDPELITLLNEKIGNCFQKFGKFRNLYQRFHFCLKESESESEQPIILNAKNDCILILEKMKKIKDASSNEERESIRRELFPLQSKIETFASIQRRTGRAKDPQTMQKNNEEGMKIKSEQYETISNSTYSKPMQNVLGSLKIYDDKLKLGLYFLTLEKEFSSWCKEHVVNVKKEYQALSYTYQNILTNKSAQNVDELVVENYEKECQSLRHKISFLSVGTENIVREIGQYYEAIQYKHNDEVSPQFKFLFKNLPAVASKLLLTGIAIEIMDGDGSSVQVSWLKAVLRCVNDDLREMLQLKHEPKLCVITVLGVQSSGKSTLLNTMFGVNFEVSAGRCTKGAFLQVIPLHMSSYPYDALLIVDTEGLSAPEFHGDHTRDNEIATFVLGISNVTIINIRGETQTKVEDFLQISVCAFMRMHLTYIKPSCVIIHHNCDSSSSNDQNLESRKAFIRTMDEAVEIQSRHLKEGKFQRFNDVVNISLQDDFYYFPSLWEGAGPSRTPQSSAYNKKANKLKDYIFEKIAKQKQEMTMQVFMKRLEDVWDAILSENFLFSLKNAREIHVRNCIEERTLTWKLNIKESFSDTVDICTKCMESFIKSNTSNNEIDFKMAVQKELQILKRKIEKRMDGTFEKQTCAFRQFIDEQTTYCEVFKSWEEKTISNLILIKDNECQEAITKFNKNFLHLQKVQQLQNHIQKLNEKVAEKARQRAQILKIHRQQANINIEFEKFWNEESLAINKENFNWEHSPKTIRDHLIYATNERYERYEEFGRSFRKLMGTSKKHEEELLLNPFQSDPSKRLIDNTIGELVQTCLNLEQYNGQTFMKMQMKNVEFDGQMLARKFIITAVSQFRRAFNAIPKAQRNFDLTPALEVKFCFKAIKKAEHFFTKAQKSYEYSMDIGKKIEKEKQAVELLFLAEFKRENEKDIVIKQMALTLHTKIYKKVFSSLTTLSVEGNFLHQILILMQKKKMLHGLVLLDIIDLLNEEEHKHLSSSEIRFLRSYFDNPFATMNMKLEEVIEAANFPIIELLYKNYSSYVSTICEKLDSMKKEKYENWNNFLSCFCQMNYIRELGIGRSDFRIFSIGEAKTSDSIINEIIFAIKRSREEFLIEKTKNQQLTRTKIHRRLALNTKEYLVSCSEICPFCKVPCDRDCPAQMGTTLQHESLAHRPLGFSGNNLPKNEFEIQNCWQYVHSDHTLRLADGKTHPARQYMECGEPYNRWSFRSTNSKNAFIWQYITYHLMDEMDKIFPCQKIVTNNEDTENSVKVFFQRLMLSFRRENSNFQYWKHISKGEAQRLVRRSFNVEDAVKRNGKYVLTLKEQSAKSTRKSVTSRTKSREFPIENPAKTV